MGEIDLASLIGKQKVVLIFSRYFGCPICQLDLKELIENQDKIISKGAKILYVTQSGKETSEKKIKELNINFPVIYSPKDGLYAEYGLGKMSLGLIASVPGKLKASKNAGFSHGEYEGSESQSPGQFVIDLNGKIIHAYKGWLNINSILENL
jgi:peroxiredoxin